MKLFFATSRALCVARGADDDWKAQWHEPGDRLECVAANADSAFAGTAGGTVLGLGENGTWAQIASLGQRVTAVTISPHDDEVVWAGTEPSGLFRSADRGETWTKRQGLVDLPSSDRWSFPPRPDTHHVRWVLEDFHDPGQLYIAIEAGALVRSPDGGETFLDHPDGARRDNHTLAMHPDESSRLYSAAGDGYAESSDQGDTWTYPQEGLDHRYVWGLAVVPDAPGDVFVSAARGAFAAHDPDGTSYVYRRRDGQWEQAMSGLPGPDGLGRAVLASAGGRVYAATNHGVFRRANGSWIPVEIDWPDARRDELPQGIAVIP